MTVLKFIRIGLVALIALLIILVIVLLIYHQHQLRKESEAYPAPGSMVQINGNQLHVYAQGEGPQTLVFMAGHGTSNPVLDFKPLWSKLSDSYRVVVIEKSGYGWSPVSSSSRSLDNMLEESRQALQLAGETGPYVLVPHSMSGLEAICWAQNYPEEVVVITALDPAVPETVAAMPEPPNAQLYSMFVISRLFRLAFLSRIPVLDVVVSSIVLVVTTWLVIRLAGKIFRTGILMIGKNATPKEVSRWIRQRHSCLCRNRRFNVVLNVS